MARIFLSGQRINNDRDFKLFRELSYRLTEKGHDIIQDDLELGKNIEYSFRSLLGRIGKPGLGAVGSE